jgi:hypothetical protein
MDREHGGERQQVAEKSVDRDPRSYHSTLRERIVEHVFVGEALRTLWRCGVFDVEVLRAEFDAHGYDVVLSRERIVRHIQFKTGTSRRPAKVSVSVALAEKPSGCVIWIGVDAHLNHTALFWFGGAPGEPLPPLSSYANPLRTTHNKEGVRPPRQNHREVPGTAFREVATLDELLALLFGRLPNAAGMPTPQCPVGVECHQT